MSSERTLLAGLSGGSATSILVLFVAAYAMPSGRPSRSVTEQVHIANPATTAPEAEAPSVGATRASEACEQRFFEQFSAMAGTDVLAQPSHESDVWNARLRAARSALLARHAPNMQIEVVIATVADPVDSGFGHQFDAQLQALQHGLESSIQNVDPTLWGASTDEAQAEHRGAAMYNRAQSWLPWDDRLASGEQRKGSAECRKQIPGVMLFRNSDIQEPSVLVALLVGETPTSGLHAASMQAALQADAALRGDRDSSATRILGPTFSGSALSLRQALLRRTSKAPVKIVSGSANGPDVPSLLSSRRGYSDPLSNVVFKTTMLPEQRLVCSYLHFVHQLGTGDGNGDGDESEEDLAASAAGRSARSRQLDGVALLHELGTEFGSSNDKQRNATTNQRACAWTPERYLAFPLHISRIRDAYEEEDRRNPRLGESDPSIARHTSLPVSLRERHPPLELQAQQSPIKSTNAQDLALARVLGAISREGIRHIGIEASDIGDAIFLARKIRDVAPDVRIAFFNADALLLHPAFRNDLHGALVVSPYPFLGAADFNPPELNERADREVPIAARRHEPFESDVAEATYNAALALRSASVPDLSEYHFIGKPHEREEVALPVWISAVGRSGLTPLAVRRSRDCNLNIYGRSAKDEIQAAACSASASPPPAGKFETIREKPLTLDPDVMPPRFWQFMFALLALLCCVEVKRLKRIQSTFAPSDIPKNAAHIDDRVLDLAFSRFKWLQYATLRTGVLSLMILYMDVTTLCAALNYSSSLRDTTQKLIWALLILGVGAAIYVTRYAFGLGRSTFQGVRALSELCRTLSSDPTTSGTRGWRAQLLSSGRSVARFFVGHAHLHTLPQLVYSSLARARFGASVQLIAMFGFAGFCAWSLVRAQLIDSIFDTSKPSAMLYLLRNLSLTNGLSVSTPMLLCMACVYISTVGGMRRVLNTHKLSRMSPQDGVRDGAATPISSIVFRGEDDSGFIYQERDLSNPILRLNALSRYTVVILATLVVPLVVFLLKPPTALEHKHDARLLFGMLVMCGWLICTNLLRFYEHWRGLDTVLSRLARHSIASSFKAVLPFAAQRIDEQISREPNDLLDLSACADELHRISLLVGNDTALTKQAQRFRKACLDGLEQQSLHPPDARFAEYEANAGLCMIRSAAMLRERLRAGYAAASWAKAAECYVATVTTLVINRHLRQVSPFLWSTTLSVMLLLAAIVSYPFEPHRALLACAWFLTLATVGLGLYIFIALDRSEILSYIARVPPGQIKFDRALFARFLIWVCVPLIAVVAAQYPQIADFVDPLIEPLSRTLR